MRHIRHALFRHAVKATHIAAVSNADPKIVVDAAESVYQRVSHVAQLVISFYQAYTEGTAFARNSIRGLHVPPVFSLFRTNFRYI